MTYPLTQNDTSASLPFHISSSRGRCHALSTQARQLPTPPQNRTLTPLSPIYLYCKFYTDKLCLCQVHYPICRLYHWKSITRLDRAAATHRLLTQAQGQATHPRRRPKKNCAHPAKKEGKKEKTRARERWREAKSAFATERKIPQRQQKKTHTRRHVQSENITGNRAGAQ